MRSPEGQGPSNILLLGFLACIWREDPIPTINMLRILYYLVGSLIRDEMQAHATYEKCSTSSICQEQTSVSPPPPVEGEGEKQLEEQCPD